MNWLSGINNVLFESFLNDCRYIPRSAKGVGSNPGLGIPAKSEEDGQECSCLRVYRIKNIKCVQLCTHVHRVVNIKCVQFCTHVLKNLRYENKIAFWRKL